MRELKRSVARSVMKAQGIERINKRRVDAQGNPTKSFFAEHWREYVGAVAGPKPKLKKTRRRMLPIFGRRVSQ